MATAKTLKSLTLAGYRVSPNDQWVLPLVTETKETERDIGGDLTRIIKPTVSLASGPLRIPPKEALDKILNTVGWELKAELYDGSVHSMTDCAVDNAPELNTDGGVMDLEISGNPTSL